jgi:hypothetical protein
MGFSIVSPMLEPSLPPNDFKYLSQSASAAIGSPKQFGEDEGATPFPRENQIFVAVENIDTEDISLGYGWSGSITYPDFKKPMLVMAL